MEKKILKVENELVLVVGSMNGDFSKLKSIKKLSNQYKYVIINGNLFSKNYISTEFPNNVIYCAGDLDYLNLRKNSKNTTDIFSYPNIVEINYNSTKYLVCCGGPSPKNSLGYSFVSLINDNPWHIYYNGKFGYVISNNPKLSNSPTYYKYSCQIGHHTKIFCQEVSKFGLNKTFEL